MRQVRMAQWWLSTLLEENGVEFVFNPAR